MGSTAGIVVIGNEVLSGKVEEENARYLIRELRELGVKLMRIAVIRDEPEVIAREVREMSDAFTHVFTTGGVGATHDDVTMESIARAFSVPIERNADLAALIEARYRDRKTTTVLRMADLPRGAELIGLGEAPFPIVKVQNVFVFPGVPAYVRAKFETLKPRLREAPIALDQLFVRVGESQIADAMREVQAAYPDVEIGSYPRYDSEEYRVKVTLESTSLARVASATEALLARFDRSWIVRIQRTAETPHH